MQKVELGTVLKERYKIVKQLGAGGMGEVFLAQDESLDTQVAIKINHNLNESTSHSSFVKPAFWPASNTPTCRALSIISPKMTPNTW